MNTLAKDRAYNRKQSRLAGLCEWSMRVGIFIMHQALATWGVIILSPLVAGAICDLWIPLAKAPSVDQLQWLLTGTPYFSIQPAFALVAGWGLWRIFHHRAMLWVWILPLLVLCIAFAAVPTLTPSLMGAAVEAGHSRFAHYFGRGCQPENRCIDQILVTLPFYTATAYSLGAKLAAVASGRGGK